MTRDEAVKKHRAMWRWIAEQIESQKKRLCILRLKISIAELMEIKFFELLLLRICFYEDKRM